MRAVASCGDRWSVRSGRVAAGTNGPTGWSISELAICLAFCLPNELTQFLRGAPSCCMIRVDWVGERRVGRAIAPYELKLSQKSNTQHLHYLQQRQVLINQTHPQSGSLFSDSQRCVSVSQPVSTALISVSALALISGCCSQENPHQLQVDYYKLSKVDRANNSGRAGSLTRILLQITEWSRRDLERREKRTVFNCLFLLLLCLFIDRSSWLGVSQEVLQQN